MFSPGTASVSVASCSEVSLADMEEIFLLLFEPTESDLCTAEIDYFSRCLSGWETNNDILNR